MEGTGARARPAGDQSVAGEGRVRVMIVVDEPTSLRQSVERLVDARVVSVTSAIEALAEGTPDGFDVFLLEHQRSDLDGLTLGTMIREINPEARLVLIDGCGDPKIEELALELGFYAVLTRPVQHRDLQPVVAL
jgi:DNA-binding NtrC family response regulator